MKKAGIFLAAAVVFVAVIILVANAQRETAERAYWGCMEQFGFSPGSVQLTEESEARFEEADAACTDS